MQPAGWPEWGLSVSNSGVLIVREDTAIKGEVRNCRQLEVYGYIEGDITAAHVLVHQGGRCYGKVKSENADVHGEMQGEVVVNDPDDTAQNLTFTVSNARNGFITLAGGRTPVSRFTQADLAGGKVSFLHDGTNTQAASFDVIVADRSGATSGAAQTVKVAVGG
jgi:hypothetical protein